MFCLRLRFSKSLSDNCSWMTCSERSFCEDCKVWTSWNVELQALSTTDSRESSTDTFCLSPCTSPLRAFSTLVANISKSALVGNFYRKDHSVCSVVKNGGGHTSRMGVSNVLTVPCRDSTGSILADTGTPGMSMSLTVTDSAGELM